MGPLEAEALHVRGTRSSLHLGGEGRQVLDLGADPAASVHVDTIDTLAGDTVADSLAPEAVRFEFGDVPGPEAGATEKHAAAHLERSVQLGDLLDRCRRRGIEPIHAVHDDGDREGTGADAGDHLVDLVRVDPQAVERARTAEAGVRLFGQVLWVAARGEGAFETYEVVRVVDRHVRLVDDGI